MTVIKRRQFLRLGASAMVGLTALPFSAIAGEPEMAAAIKDLFGDKPISEGPLALKLPTLSESGYFVPVEVDAESPMTDDDYIRRIAIFSERNPIPLIASYNFTPLSGRARAAGKIRLGGSQIVHAVAEHNDGRLFGTSAKVFVTLAACVVN